MDPIEEMKGCLGVVRRRLWLYMLSCFPQDLGVIMEIGKLEEKSKGRHIVCGIEEIIISRLNRGRISDCDFAARIWMKRVLWNSPKNGSPATSA